MYVHIVPAHQISLPALKDIIRGGAAAGRGWRQPTLPRGSGKDPKLTKKRGKNEKKKRKETLFFYATWGGAILLCRAALS